MRYFTRQLWLDAQAPGEAGRESDDRWAEAFKAYARQLESLRHRLRPDVFAFFQDADVHDGALTELRIRDFDPAGAKPAPIAEPPGADDGADDGPWEGPYRVTVELTVATWNDGRHTQWTLRYARLRRILVDFPSESPLFYHPGDGFEDWGYHELSDAGDGFLRHEVLFSSGSTVLVEFRDLFVERVDPPVSST